MTVYAVGGVLVLSNLGNLLRSFGLPASRRDTCCNQPYWETSLNYARPLARGKFQVWHDPTDPPITPDISTKSKIKTSSTRNFFEYCHKPSRKVPQECE